MICVEATCFNSQWTCRLWKLHADFPHKHTSISTNRRLCLVFGMQSFGNFFPSSFFPHSVWKHRKYTLDLRISNCREIWKPFSNLIKSMWENVSSSHLPFKLHNLCIPIWEARHRVPWHFPLSLFMFWNLHVTSEWSGRNNYQRPKQAIALHKKDVPSREKIGVPSATNIKHPSL